MADPPRIVAPNPWSSLRAWLDDDGATVYLHIGPGTGELESRQSVWVRNDGEAPPTHPYESIVPEARLAQTRSTTRHPDGKPLQRGQVLELLWFESGDGVALMVDGQLEAVLPPWSGRGGVRGYAVEARGRGPFAWELTVPNPLSTRVARARAHWDALNHGGLFALIEAADRAYLVERLGAHDSTWSVTPPGEPPRRVSRFTMSTERSRAPFVYTTLGMASQPMPRCEAEREDHVQLQRAQLAFAPLVDGEWVPKLLGELARYPWHAVRWFGDTDVVDTRAPEGKPHLLAPPDAPDRFTAILLLADPPADGARPAPTLSGQLERSGEPVNWLWLVPLTEAERVFVEAHGSEPLIAKLRAAGIGWIFDAARASVV